MAALQLRFEAVFARKEALALREENLKARLQAEQLRVAENTAAAGRQVGAAQIGAPTVGPPVIPIEELIQQRVELVMQERLRMDRDCVLEAAQQMREKAALARAEAPRGHCGAIRRRGPCAATPRRRSRVVACAKGAM